MLHAFDTVLDSLFVAPEQLQKLCKKRSEIALASICSTGYNVTRPGANVIGNSTSSPANHTDSSLLE